MKGLGSGDSGEFTFIDFLALASFWISLQNLELNLTQKDKQDLENRLAEKSQDILDEIHGHLTLQDKKIDMILERLEVSDNAADKET